MINSNQIIVFMHIMLYVVETAYSQASKIYKTEFAHFFGRDPVFTAADERKDNYNRFYHFHSCLLSTLPRIASHHIKE